MLRAFSSGLVIVVCFLIAVACSPQNQAKQGLTPDGKAYVRNLQLSEISMKATESYAMQTVTEIEGKITNAGARTIVFAEVTCIFYDRYGQVTKRERVPIIKAAMAPGDIRKFRLPFDDLPESWNRQLPQLVIASIRFS
jgi:hypothetical protein